MTCDEEKQGWLLGPFSSTDELDKCVGATTIVNRRFPLRQGEKIRAIDDYSESAVNLAAGSVEKVTLHDADVIASLIRALQGVGSGSITQLEKSDGTIKQLRAHPDWKSNIPILGRTIDLSRAYKQLVAHPESWWVTGGVVYNTDDLCPSLFLQKTLPVGASLSVSSFNRCFCSLWALGPKKLLIPWLVFFDDFPMVIPEPLAPLCSSLSELLFAVIGCKIASGAKVKPFSGEFVALGVVFVPGLLSNREGVAKKKPDRLEALSSMVRTFKAKGGMNKHELSAFRGKVQFMELQIFGRVGRSVRQILEGNESRSFINGQEVTATLDWVLSWLSSALPRQMHLPIDPRPKVLFTDGAYELMEGKPRASCGAILFDPSDNSSHVFGTPIPEEILQQWRSSNKSQYITESEFFPILLAKQTWRYRRSASKILVFVDSEPATYMCIAGHSHIKSCNQIVKNIAQEDAYAQTWSWYARYPLSATRLTDHPGFGQQRRFAGGMPRCMSLGSRSVRE